MGITWFLYLNNEFNIKMNKMATLNPNTNLQRRFTGNINQKITSKGNAEQWYAWFYSKYPSLMYSCFTDEQIRHMLKVRTKSHYAYQDAYLKR